MNDANMNAVDSPGVVGSGRAVAGALRDWLTGVTGLATLEVRHSLQSLHGALTAALALGAVLFAGWCLILAAVAAAVIEAGWPWITALLFVTALNLAGALFLWLRVRTLLERVGLDRTRRALGLDGTFPHADAAQKPARGRT